MKRLLFVFVGLLAAIFIALPLFPKVYQGNPPIKQPSQVTPQVRLTIDFGDKISTIAGIFAVNAYDALVFGTKKENIPITMKQYDFGVFVESVGDKKSSSEKAWIYFVNGEPGKEAADKTLIKSDDSVEWKYIKPATE